MIILLLFIQFILFTSAEIVKGNCGRSTTPEECQYEYNDKSKVLRIKGSGQVNSYSSSSEVPWNSYASSIEILIVEEGITSLGQYSFSSCSSLKTVSLPQSLKSWGSWVFERSLVKHMTLPSQMTSIGLLPYSLKSLFFPSSVNSFSYLNFKRL